MQKHLVIHHAITLRHCQVFDNLRADDSKCGSVDDVNASSNEGTLIVNVSAILLRKPTVIMNNVTK